MMVKKIDDKEADEKKMISNLYHEKRNGIMKNTQFELEEIFVDKFGKKLFS